MTGCPLQPRGSQLITPVSPVELPVLPPPPSLSSPQMLDLFSVRPCSSFNGFVSLSLQPFSPPPTYPTHLPVSLPQVPNSVHKHPSVFPETRQATPLTLAVLQGHVPVVQVVTPSLSLTCDSLIVTCRCASAHGWFIRCHFCHQSFFFCLFSWWWWWWWWWW